MKLAALLTFLIALALGSGSRCKHPWKNQQGYNEFSEKHILSMVVKGKLKVKELNDMFKDYLQKRDLCGRVELQTFFRQCDRGKVEYICNGQGFIDGTGNLCISKQKFSVYKVESKTVNGSCKIKKVTADSQYVIVGCGKIHNKCLPVHFDNQTDKAPNQNAARCKPSGGSFIPNNYKTVRIN